MAPGEDQLHIKLVMNAIGVNTVLKDITKIELGADRIKKKYAELGIVTQSQFNNLQDAAVAQKINAQRQKEELQVLKAKQQRANKYYSAIAQQERAQLAATRAQQAALRAVTRETTRFRMEFLGIMFFGMAMQRMFGGLLRASFTTWNAITEGTSAAGGAMTQLLAGWEYFKYSLFDALQNSGIFQYFIDVVLRLVEWFGNLSQGTKAWIAGLVVAGFVIGTILSTVGQLAIGLDAVSRVLVGQNFSIAAMKLGYANVAKTVTEKLIPSMAAAWSAAGPFILIAAILLAIGYIFWLGKQLNGVTELFKALARGAIMAVALIGRGIVEYIGKSFDWVLLQIEVFLKTLREVAWVIDYLTGTNLAGRLDSYISGVSTLRAGVQGLFGEFGKDITGAAAQFIEDNIPLKNDGADVSFSSYISGITNAVVEGIKGSAPAIGAEIGRNTTVKGGVGMTVVTDNQFAESLKRQGYGDLI